MYIYSFAIFCLMVQFEMCVWLLNSVIRALRQISLCQNICSISSIYCIWSIAVYLSWNSCKAMMATSNTCSNQWVHFSLPPPLLFSRFMSTQKYIYLLIQRSEFHILKFGTTKFISVLIQSSQFQISKFFGSPKCNYVLVQSS